MQIFNVFMLYNDLKYISIQNDIHAQYDSEDIMRYELTKENRLCFSKTRVLKKTIYIMNRNMREI